jgi:hypothetical protein
MGVKITITCDMCKCDQDNVFGMRRIHVRTNTLEPDGRDMAEYKGTSVAKGLLCENCLTTLGLVPVANFMDYDHPAKALTLEQKLTNAMRDFTESIIEDTVPEVVRNT